MGTYARREGRSGTSSSSDAPYETDTELAVRLQQEEDRALAARLQQEMESPDKGSRKRRPVPMASPAGSSDGETTAIRRLYDEARWLGLPEKELPTADGLALARERKRTDEELNAMRSNRPPQLVGRQPHARDSEPGFLRQRMDLLGFEAAEQPRQGRVPWFEVMDEQAGRQGLKRPPDDMPSSRGQSTTKAPRPTTGDGGNRLAQRPIGAFFGTASKAKSGERASEPPERAGGSESGNGAARGTEGGDEGAGAHAGGSELPGPDDPGNDSGTDIESDPESTGSSTRFVDFFQEQLHDMQLGSSSKQKEPLSSVAANYTDVDKIQIKGNAKALQLLVGPFVYLADRKGRQLKMGDALGVLIGQMGPWAVYLHPDHVGAVVQDLREQGRVICEAVGGAGSGGCFLRAPATVSTASLVRAIEAAGSESENGIDVLLSAHGMKAPVAHVADLLRRVEEVSEVRYVVDFGFMFKRPSENQVLLCQLDEKAVDPNDPDKYDEDAAAVLFKLGSATTIPLYPGLQPGLSVDEITPGFISCSLRPTPVFLEMEGQRQGKIEGHVTDLVVYTPIRHALHAVIKKPAVSTPLLSSPQLPNQLQPTQHTGRGNYNAHGHGAGEQPEGAAFPAGPGNGNGPRPH